MRNHLRLFSLVVCLILTNCQSDGNPPINKEFRFNGIITVDGRARTFILQLPGNYYDNDTTRFTLVVALHGTGGSAAQFEQDYHFSEKAEAGKFIIVYPDGVRGDGAFGIRTWNAGRCCDYAMYNNVNDVLYISTLIDDLVAHHKVNPKKVYVTGMSNGAMMTYRLACELSNKIAAIAPVSGTLMVSQPCNPSRAVPVLHIHSVVDTKIPYYGGIGIGGYYFTPVDSALQVWSSLNVCSDPRVLVDDSAYRLTEWSNCKSGVEMQCYLTRDGGHAWPGGQKSRPAADPPSTVISATDVIWDFFQRFELP